MSVKLGENSNREQCVPHSECVSVGDDMRTSGRFETEFRGSYSFATHLQGDELTEDVVGGTCRRHGGWDWTVTAGDTGRARLYGGSLGVGGRILLKWF